MPALGAGLYASGLRSRTWWPVWLLAAGSAALYCIAATPTGMRRSIALTFASSLLLGCLFDWALSAPRISRFPIWAASLAVLLWLGGETYATARGYRDGTLALPHDFDWIEPNMGMLLGKEELDPRVRERVLALDQPIRAMCLLDLLNPRIRPASAPRFSVREIREYYLSSDPEKFK